MVALTASFNDAPRDDLDIEDDVFTPGEAAQVRSSSGGRADRTIYRVIARERSTGALAGHSTIVVEQAGATAHPPSSTTPPSTRAHRGHRLGALVKTAMLLWMRDEESAVTQLDTWNAESNAHMIAINEQLNYRIVARSIAYQKSL